ncbi:class I SAM-dependent methyltransferase [Burkholderia cenocepacia]|uniref:class I SAM-dependent methyltransferase n=1 Tax=Burkholderia cenocepacia TaxID=95486 RepID=UPI000761E914|nr:class I SAM-dependent methyltransferase [Burkholderia cenocepacia]KWU19087.1 hypothetical protein AS149_12635 [Burkholderia cenocepacia]
MQTKDKTLNERTLEVYAATAATYQALTQALDASSGREMLTSRLPRGAAVLDAGCGWGRDAKEFRKDGYAVTAFDGCPEMAALACGYALMPVSTLRFQNVSFPPMFDGIWARASLLHLEHDELVDALRRLLASLRPGGWMYACFKEGEGEQVDDAGRYFYFMTEQRFGQLLAVAGGKLVETTHTPDQFGRGHQWLNFLVQHI